MVKKPNPSRGYGVKGQKMQPTHPADIINKLKKEGTVRAHKPAESTRDKDKYINTHTIYDNKIAMPNDNEKYSPKGRTLRKAFERPRPDLPANAPENRSKKQIALSLDREMVEKLNMVAKERGVNRNSLIEKAIITYLSPK